MANNYFDFIGQNAGEEKKEAPQQTQAMANVTVRCDADCFLLCDGEYLDIQLDAGKMAKIQVPIGQHLLEFLYTEDPDIKIEKEVDFPDAGKSYLIIIKGLKDLGDGANAEAQAKAAEEEAKRKAKEKEAKRKAEAEAKRKAEEEAKLKAEEEAREKALNPTDAEAQYQLGVRYLEGDGIEENKDKAISWLEKSAKQGYAEAQYTLGFHYLKEEEKKDSYEKIWDKPQSLLEKAAKQGHVSAMTQLGLLIIRTNSRDYDITASPKWLKGLKWLDKAAGKGCIIAKYKVGAVICSKLHSYMNGDGDEYFHDLKELSFSKRLKYDDEDELENESVLTLTDISIELLTEMANTCLLGYRLEYMSAMYALAVSYLVKYCLTRNLSFLNKSQEWFEEYLEELEPDDEIEKEHMYNHSYEDSISIVNGWLQDIKKVSKGEKGVALFGDWWS